MNDNSTYTVTPPSLHITEDGINVLLCSTNSKFIEDVKDIFEKHLRSSIVFYVQQNKTNSETIAWMWNVSNTCDIMIVDIDTCAWEDIMAALLKPLTTGVLFYSEKYKRRETAKLINATGTNIIVRNIDEVALFVSIQLQAEDINDI